MDDILNNRHVHVKYIYTMPLSFQSQSKLFMEEIWCWMSWGLHEHGIRSVIVQSNWIVALIVPFVQMCMRPSNITFSLGIHQKLFDRCTLGQNIDSKNHARWFTPYKYRGTVILAKRKSQIDRKYINTLFIMHSGSKWCTLSGIWKT